MVIETTFFNKDHKKLIENLVGTSYSFIEKLKMGGVGSKRMIVENVSPNMHYILNTSSDINYANIELRSRGIIVHITKGLYNYAWLIPFYQLVLYKTNFISIHAQGRFVTFANNKMFVANKTFFSKIMAKKIAYDQEFSSPIDRY